MGLLFHPRPLTGATTRPRSVAVEPSDAEIDRRLVFRAAIEAIIVGDASRFPTYFTDDVHVCTPRLAESSLVRVQAAFGSPEDSLTAIEVVIDPVDVVGDKLVAEWSIEARFSRPILLDDDELLEPTGRPIHLVGASIAEFRGAQICSFRHYFDDSIQLCASFEDSWPS